MLAGTANPLVVTPDPLISKPDGALCFQQGFTLVFSLQNTLAAVSTKISLTYGSP